MPEYFVSILNWPVEGENPEDAARNAYRSLKSDPTGFYLTVTDEEGSLCHVIKKKGRQQARLSPFGFKEREEFDSYEFEKEEEEDD